MIGRTIAHYRIVERLGAGGMGVVYKAEDLRLGRPVALKFLPPEMSSSRTAVDRFEREARTASSLNHPNICTIYAIEEHDGQRFLVMELLDGQPLSEVIGGRPMPVDTVIELGTQIADALDAAHAQGILHRDVKPANIFITRRGRAKVLDFGLAKLAVVARDTAAHDSNPTLAELKLTTQGVALGTVAYMSPEQARGEPLDARSDIFSLGIVLYEMVTGQQAFPGRTSAVVFDQILNRMPAPASLLEANVPKELERIVMKSLEKDPDDRQQSAAAVAEELEQLRRSRDSGRQTAAIPAVQPSPTPREVESADPAPSGPSFAPASPPAASSAPPPVTSSSLSYPYEDDDDTPTYMGSATDRTGVFPLPMTGAGASPSAAGNTRAAAGAHAVDTPQPVPPAQPAAAQPSRGPRAAATPRSNRAGAIVLGFVVLLAVVAGGAAIYFRRDASAVEQAPPVAQTAPPQEHAFPPQPEAASQPPAEAQPPEEGAETASSSGSSTPPRTAAAPTRRRAARRDSSESRGSSTPAASDNAPSEAASVVPAPAAPDPATQLLRAARTKADAHRYDEALVDLRSILHNHASSGEVPGAFLLMGRIAQQQRRWEDGIAACTQVRSRFPSSAATPEASVLLGQMLERSKRPDRVEQARAVLAEVPQRFPDSPWAPRALSAKALLETRERVKGTDPALGSVPAAFVSNLQLATRYPASPQAEVAMWQAAEVLEDKKAYERAAQMFLDLAARFPSTRYDAAWRAAEIYDRRLENDAAARNAYGKVPPASRNFKEAQKRAAR
jgi:serine/threonine protein kinase/TolA-binding protein